MKKYPTNTKAVLIDFDGTLVDSLSALKKCFHTFLETYQVKASDEAFSALIGPSLLEIVGRLKHAYALPGTLENLYKEYCSLVQNAYANEILPFPHALDVLKGLKKRGLKLAIVTSAPASLLEVFLMRFSLQNFFDALITSSSEEPSKPSPDLYLRALETLGVSADQAIAVEDSSSGIQSAYSAGLYVIQFGISNPILGSSLVLDNWIKIDEALRGYQTHLITPDFEVKVVSSRDKLELSDVDAQVVDRIWDAAQAHHEGRLFNGRFLNYVGFEKGRLIGEFVEYKHYLAQKFEPGLKESLRICPIAISCLCLSNDKVLIGKRSLVVTDYKGCYELVPSGGIDPSIVENGKVNVVKQALIELNEETGIVDVPVSCLPTLVVHDLTSNSYEVCVHIELHRSQWNASVLIEGEAELKKREEIFFEKKMVEKGLFRSSYEYTQLEWMSLGELGELIGENRENWVPFSLFLIHKYLNYSK